MLLEGEGGKEDSRCSSYGPFPELKLSVVSSFFFFFFSFFLPSLFLCCLMKSVPFDFGKERINIPSVCA